MQQGYSKTIHQGRVYSASNFPFRCVLASSNKPSNVVTKQVVIFVLSRSNVTFQADITMGMH